MTNTCLGVVENLRNMFLLLESKFLFSLSELSLIMRPYFRVEEKTWKTRKIKGLVSSHSNFRSQLKCNFHIQAFYNSSTYVNYYIPLLLFCHITLFLSFLIFITTCNYIVICISISFMSLSPHWPSAP